MSPSYMTQVVLCTETGIKKYIIKKLNCLDRNALRGLLQEPLWPQNSFLTQKPRPGNAATKACPALFTYKLLLTADRSTAAAWYLMWRYSRHKLGEELGCLLILPSLLDWDYPAAAVPTFNMVSSYCRPESTRTAPAGSGKGGSEEGEGSKISTSYARTWHILKCGQFALDMVQDLNVQATS